MQSELQKVFSRPVRSLVGGKWYASAASEGIDLFNPASGVLLATIPRGAEEDAHAAVISARAALEKQAWSGAPVVWRKSVLHRFADLISRDATLLDMIDAVEMGKPVSVQRFNASSAANHMRFHAEAADKISGDVIPTDSRSHVVLRWTPRGVVGAITPWNFPTFNAIMKIAPALAAGNSVVLKPSELSTFSALHLGELALEAGVPEGVLNVVPGVGLTVGRALALHNEVDMIAFTGSTQVGQEVFRYAGSSNMKSVLAECGGKSPQIVFRDGVDLDAAADFIALFLLTNQGQVCSAGTRLLVEKGVEDELLGKLVRRFGEIRAGDPAELSTTFGPLVSQKQFDKVLHYIDSARKNGADLVVGGGRMLEESGGNFLAPTILRNVTPDAPIVQDEIFGPVLAVITFDGVEEAIKLANGTRYGLSCYAWTGDLRTAMLLGEQIKSSLAIRSGRSEGQGAGHASTNEPYAMSGSGPEGGVVGQSSYLRRRSVSVFF